MSTDHYTYRVTWSAEDAEQVGLCGEFPALSWLAATPEEALSRIRTLVKEVVADLQASNETVPEPFAERKYSLELRSGETVFLDLAKAHLSRVHFLNNHSLQKIPCPVHFSTIMKY